LGKSAGRPNDFYQLMMRRRERGRESQIDDVGRLRPLFTSLSYFKVKQCGAVRCGAVCGKEKADDNCPPWGAIQSHHKHR